MSNSKLKPWRTITGIILLTAPFTPWVLSPLPNEPPSSPLYLVNTFWQDTLAYMFLNELLRGTLITLAMLNVCFLGYLLISQKQRHAWQLASLLGNFGLFTWTFNTFIYNVGWGWGFWLYGWGLFSANLYWFFTLAKGLFSPSAQVTTST